GAGDDPRRSHGWLLRSAFFAAPAESLGALVCDCGWGGHGHVLFCPRLLSDEQIIEEAPRRVRAPPATFHFAAQIPPSSEKFRYLLCRLCASSHPSRWQFPKHISRLDAARHR